jgi:hypothetical protein
VYSNVHTMALVSLEQDKRYRRAQDRYVEVCVTCGTDREGKTERCACGTVFAKPTSNFLKLRWTPTSLVPKMPDVCPHCDGAIERLRSITLRLSTGYQGGADAATSGITIEFGTCKRVPPPYLMWLACVTAVFFVVVFGLAALFGIDGALVPGAFSLVGLVAAWRAYGWLRFARFDHRSIRLRARRLSYARALADRNGGRVL